MEVKQQRKIAPWMLHGVIGLIIMIGFKFLPLSMPGVTSVGQEVMGIFLGTLYLWTTVDPLWGSLLSLVMLGFSHYAPMNKVLSMYLGNPVIIQLFFMMVIVGILVTNNITNYIGRFFLTRKVIEGRPWMFTGVIMLAATTMAVLLGAFIPIFLLWPILYDIFADLGYTKEDKYPRVLLILVVIASLIGFPVPPYMSNSLALISNYAMISEKAGHMVQIQNGPFLVVTILLSLLILLAILLATRFIIRPDVSKLKAFSIDKFKNDPLPPMNRAQKLCSGIFIVYLLAMILPSIVPNLPGMEFLRVNTFGICVLFTAIMAAISVDGKPLMNMNKIMASEFSWPTFFLCATAIMLGSVLTDEKTGITKFLTIVLSPIFKGMNPTTFIIVLLLSAGFLTNICNSLVIGMILQPVILLYCQTSGANAAPIVTLMIFYVLMSAAVTPAASPFAACMFGNKEWLKSSEIMKYSLLYVLIMLAIVLVVGIPLVNVVM